MSVVIVAAVVVFLLLLLVLLLLSLYTEIDMPSMSSSAVMEATAGH